MSDLTPQELDELASAYLDGEATAEERAMVEADPDLLARAEQFRQAAAEVASPVAEAGREESISQALESFKPAKAKPAKARPGKLSAWLGQGNWKMPRLRLPSQDRLRNPKLVPIFSVAAVLVVVFLAISIIVLLGDDTSDDDSEALAPDTTSAAIQASEADQFLESAEFQAATGEILDGLLDEMSITPAAIATSTTAPQPVSLSDASAADDDASADFTPAAEGRASDTEESEAEKSVPAELADADISTSTGECLTEGGIEAPSDEDISDEGELEDTDEEPEPGDPDAIERSPSPSFDDRPATELEVPEPPSVRPSPPPAESSAVSSNTIPSDFEDAPLIEC